MVSKGMLCISVGSGEDAKVFQGAEFWSGSCRKLTRPTPPICFIDIRELSATERCSWITCLGCTINIHSVHAVLYVLPAGSCTALQHPLRTTPYSSCSALWYNTTSGRSSLHTAPKVTLPLHSAAWYVSQNNALTFLASLKHSLSCDPRFHPC